MKKEDIPQQAHNLYEGETKVVYAVNKQGKLEVVQTTGWEAESVVLTQAIAEINRLTEEALTNVRNGYSSPLEYHMYAQRMDLPMLAKSVGRFRWHVKRHLKPKGFAKLDSKELNLYAHALGIDVETLKQVPND